MRRLTLTEFSTLRAVALTPQERDGVRRLHPGIRLEPSAGTADLYDLTPDQRIGLVCLPTLIIEVRPKVPISSVLFLISYACEAVSWFDTLPPLAADLDAVEMIAAMLARQIEQATRRGLLNGYQSVEEGLTVPRGRILFDEQIRRRSGVAPPIEVRHDVFTSDVLENRLLLAALATMSQMRLRSSVVRRELVRALLLFGSVTRVRFDRSAVPEVGFTRLNQHYRPAVGLASIVLRSSSLDLGAGTAPGAAFLIDMNAAFERFVRRALREALGLDAVSFPERPRGGCLDEAGAVPLRPDLCLMQGGQIVWVGDAKYKRLPVGGYRNADLYQLLAYATALDLPGGTLVYAATDGIRATEHVVVKAGKRLRVVAIDLAAPRATILRQIESLAGYVEVHGFSTPLSAPSPPPTPHLTRASRQQR